MIENFVLCFGIQSSLQLCLTQRIVSVSMKVFIISVVLLLNVMRGDSWRQLKCTDDRNMVKIIHGVVNCWTAVRISHLTVNVDGHRNSYISWFAVC